MKSWICFPFVVRKTSSVRRLNSFEFWIENLCRPNRWKFFSEQIAAIVRTDKHFSQGITPAVRMAFLSILNAWQTTGKRFLDEQIPIGVCFCVRGHNKKEIKDLRFTDEDLIVYSRMNNLTVSTWCDRSTWPASEGFGWSSHHSAWTLPVDRPFFWALNHHPYQ